jgi:hypothetical protein
MSDEKESAIKQRILSDMEYCKITAAFRVLAGEEFERILSNDRLMELYMYSRMRLAGNAGKEYGREYERAVLEYKRQLKKTEESEIENYLKSLVN